MDYDELRRIGEASSELLDDNVPQMYRSCIVGHDATFRSFHLPANGYITNVT